MLILLFNGTLYGVGFVALSSLQLRLLNWHYSLGLLVTSQ